MLKTRLLLFLLFLGLYSSAQDVMLPYLKNQFYGLADKDGKIVVEPIYQEVKLEAALGMYAFQQNGKWGMMNKKGEILLQPLLQKYRCHHAFLSRTLSNEPVQRPMLFKVTDDLTKIHYFIYPDKPLKNYQAFREISDITRGRKSHSTSYNFPEYKMIKVGTMQGKVNFIDSLGQLIFNEGFYDGEIMSENIIAVQQAEDGLFALFNSKGVQLTEFVYNRVNKTGNKEYVSAYLKFETENNGSDYKYELIHYSGKVIASNLTKIDPIDKERVLLNSKVKSGLYYFDGRPIFEKNGCHVQRLGYTDKTRFKVSSNFKYGLLDINGDLLIDTIYQSIELSNSGQYVFNTEDNKAGLIDYELNTILSLDSLHMEKDNRYAPGYFVVRKSGDYKYISGLVDSMGSLVVPIKYKRLGLTNKCGLIKVKNENSEEAFVDFNDNLIIPFSKNKLSINCRRNLISAATDSSQIQYDLKGKLISEMSIEEIKKLRTAGQGSSIPEIFTDQRGAQRKKADYKFFSNRDDKTNRLIYFGRPNNRNAQPRINVIVNDRGIEITPKEYGLPEEYTYNKTGENGAIPVVHVKDAADKTNVFRSGLIDFDGNWLVEPDYRLITRIGNELHALMPFLGGEMTIHDRYGNLVNDKGYSFFEKDPNEKILNNRIVAGVAKDKAAFKKTSQQFAKAWDQFNKDGNRQAFYGFVNSLKEPELIFGYIDGKGNEVIDTKFMAADPFQYSYTTVIGEGPKGKTYSAVIDTEGNELLRTDYEKLKILYVDSTWLKTRQHDQFGVIDLAGNVILPAQYSAIESNAGFLQVNEGEQAFAITKNGKRALLGPAGGRTDIKELYDGYYFSKVTKKMEDGKYARFLHVFDKDGNEYGEFTDKIFDTAGRLDGKFNDVVLPVGFMTIYPGRSAKPYIFDFINRKSFKE